MSAGVLTLCAEKLGCALQGLFEVGARHTCLNGDGLVDLVKGYDLVEAAAHVEADAALYRLDASRDGAAAAVDVQRNGMLGRICDDLFHLLRGVGVKHDVRHGVYDLVAQTQNVVCGEAVGDGKAVVIRDGEALLPHDLAKRIEMLLSKLHGVVGKLDLVKADVVGILFKVIVGELKDFLHHLVQRFLGVLEKFGVAPTEYGAVAVLRCGGIHPLGLKALIRFVTH